MLYEEAVSLEWLFIAQRMSASSKKQTERQKERENESETSKKKAFSFNIQFLNAWKSTATHRKLARRVYLWQWQRKHLYRHIQSKLGLIVKRNCVRMCASVKYAKVSVSLVGRKTFFVLSVFCAATFLDSFFSCWKLMWCVMPALPLSSLRKRNKMRKQNQANWFLLRLYVYHQLLLA